MTALALVAYCLSVAAAFPVSYRFLLRWRLDAYPSISWDQTDRGFCTAISFLVALIWPVVLALVAAGVVLMQVAKHVEGSVK